MTSNNLAISIFKSRNNILEILEEARNFDITNYKNYSINEIGILINNEQLDMLLEKPDGIKVYIKYYINKVLNAQKIYDIVEDLYNIESILTKKDDLYLIVKDDINDTIIQTIKEIWLNENIYISIISLKNLQFNILKHKMVPKHRVLTETEKEEIKKKYNILRDSNIAGISYFDPVALALGLRPGNLVEIDRNSKTSISSKFYRICQIY